MCGTVWCVAATCLAVYAEDTSDVLALVAALCGAPLMSVLPTLMLLRSRHGMGPRQVALHASLLALGMAVTAANILVQVA